MIATVRLFNLNVEIDTLRTKLGARMYTYAQRCFPNARLQITAVCPRPQLIRPATISVQFPIYIYTLSVL